MARLPTPGGDNNTWGDVLNSFLKVEHNSDGTQKTLALTKGGTGAKDAGTALTNLGAVPGTDSRLSDQRVPTDGSVTDAKIATGGLSPSSTAGTAVITTDSRLSDARPPAPSTGDLTLASDSDANGSGDIILKTAGVERARIKYDGTGSGWSNVLGGSRSFASPSKPSGLGWDETHFGFNVTSVADILGTPRSVATLDKTPEQIFDAFSAARSAPTQTYYVATTGNDSSGDGSSGNPWKSRDKAVTAANSAGTPTKILMAPGTYHRNLGTVTVGSVIPTVDIAFIANGGRVVTGTFDNISSASYDGTQTNCQTLTVSSVDRVCDTANLNRFGNYTELAKVSTAALCNATPNTWALVSTTLYINRADQQQVTVNNTRVYRPATNCLRITNEVNIYIGGASPGDGFDMEGAQGGGVLHYSISAPGSTNHVLVARDSTFRYPGGYTDTSDVRAVSVESLKGFAFFWNCRADCGMSDGFNFHNTNSAAGMYVCTVNCTGFDNGRNGNVSCNGWTSHDTVVGIDICGYYEGNHGGSCRSINTSKTWFYRTAVKDDLGDLCYGGSVVPTAFEVDDTATYWCERTKVLMAAGAKGYVAGASGATVNQRQIEPCGLPNYGSGTFATF